MSPSLLLPALSLTIQTSFVANANQQTDVLPKGVKALMDNGLVTIPGRYIKPPSHRAVKHLIIPGVEIPVIDMAALESDREKFVQTLCKASSEWGIFQVINHGIPVATMQGMEARFQLCFKCEPSEPLMSALSEGLGLDSNRLVKSFGDSEMILRSNYYLPCPNPDLALGMNGHTDSGGLTILFEDQVGGLQARKGDLWYDLKPIKNAFIVNIADQLEILSNGKYKSIEHRVLVQPDQTRLSIVAFCNPSRDAVIGPLPELIDEQNPPLYKSTLYQEHITNVYTKYLDGKHSQKLQIK
ncbi:probable 2-oxoglutarate-dependent dioxygenase At3g111800 [Selaginella moellendorffii]|uniref:probable 2-oxoglutarate-dependent dioxygenase At3g111800 n=1 Tax=Selaginella moellendorffii TaxID=88036 RepID=UPI000D1C63AB|nr:probable 2-oxoglutarate-dependent dioxygenase At3g111800 [Selaginella moellendorffii]|eukprot:XP_024544277.1 probable 2-oxoglutarate-dependent dioxygenase At3g111800 [Selaginella moellendorffii]